MGKKIAIEFEGKWYDSFNDLVRQLGVVNPDRVRQREKKGWSRKKALLTPLFSKNVPRKTKADYHRLAEGRGWKWRGEVVPMGTDQTEWECDKGHKRDMTFTSVAEGNECWDCYTERFKDPDFVDPRSHPEEDYYRLAEVRGINYLGPFPSNCGIHTEWQCAKGHKAWQATYNRIQQGDGCPSCSGRRADFDNNLELLFPDVADTWHQTLNGDLLPSDVTPGSHKEVWWHCPKSKLSEYPHDYPAKVKERTRSDGPTGCPCCAGTIVCPDTCLSYTHREIAAQWHPTKNGKVKPSDVTYGSGIKRYWLCKRHPDEKWYVSPNARTGHGEGTWCPACTNQTSRFEIRVYTELRTIFEDAKWKKKDLGPEVDILLQSARIGIEIDGAYWHAGHVERDREKNKILEELGYTLVRLRGKGLPLIGQHDVVFDESQSAAKAIRLLFSKLIGLVSSRDLESMESYLSHGQYRNDGEYKRIVTHLPAPPAGETFEDKQPKVAEFWDYQKNSPLTPDLFAPQSNEEVWWMCFHKDYHPSVRRTFYNAIRRPKCDYCLGKKVHKLDSLATLYPELLKDWDYNRNKIWPDEVWPKWKGPRLQVFWICSECGNEWSSPPYNRCVKKSGCRRCIARARNRAASDGRFD